MFCFSFVSWHLESQNTLSGTSMYKLYSMKDLRMRIKFLFKIYWQTNSATLISVLFEFSLLIYTMDSGLCLSFYAVLIFCQIYFTFYSEIYSLKNIGMAYSRRLQNYQQAVVIFLAISLYIMWNYDQKNIFTLILLYLYILRKQYVHA